MIQSGLGSGVRRLSSIPFLAAGLVLFWLGHAMVLASDARVSTAGFLAVVAWSLVLLIWGAVSSWLAISGQYDRPGFLAFSPGLWTPTIPVGASVALMLLPVDLREAMLTLAANTATHDFLLLQSLRLAALGSLLKARNGTMPPVFGFGLGIPDALFGLSAVLLLLQCGSSLSPILLMVWNVVGAAILLAAPVVLHFSMPGSSQVFRGMPDGRALFRFPLVLAPTLLAPLFLVSNVLHLSVLAGAAQP